MTLSLRYFVACLLLAICDAQGIHAPQWILNFAMRVRWDLEAE